MDGREFIEEIEGDAGAMSAVTIRHLDVGDFDRLIRVVDEWWGGRPVRGLLPRLFFEHFSTTSFAIGSGEDLHAFLVGFRSQSFPEIAYIHFVGVAPAYRGHGYGRHLYARFFACVAALGCTEVRAITSPVNTGSIAFHRRLGFTLIDAGGWIDGIPVSLDHAGEGAHRVLFRRELAPEQKIL